VPSSPTPVILPDETAIAPSQAPASRIFALLWRVVLPEHVFLLLFVLMLAALRAVYQPANWHGTHDFTIRTSFGILAALTSMAFFARLPAIARGERSGLRAAASEGARAFHQWLPFSLCALIYENLHDLTNLIRHDTFDDSLMALDHRIFGVQPTVWLEAHVVTPLLTDWMVISYGLYFFLPAALLLVAYRREDETRFRTLSVALLLVFLAGFLSYVSIPAIGPRYWLRDRYLVPVLRGRFFASDASQVFGALEAVQRDCFPSLHTALSGLALFYAFAWRRTLPGRGLWFAVYLPLVLSIWASTIYLRQHWFVDVIGGWALVAVVVTLAPAIVRLSAALRRRVLD